MLKWIKHQYKHWIERRSLQFQVLLLSVLVTFIFGLGMGTLSYQRHAQQHEINGRQWAQSVAFLASKAGLTPMLEKDYGSLEKTLKEIATLPGVIRIQVIKPQQQILLTISADTKGGLTTLFPQAQYAELPPTSTDHVFLKKATHANHITAYALLLSDWTPYAHMADLKGASIRNGWIEVTYSYEAQMQQSIKQWIQTIVLYIIVVLVAIWAFNWFLNRTTHPIKVLSQFATTLAKGHDQQIDIKGGSQEIHQLQQSLNQASTHISTQMRTIRQQLDLQRTIIETACDAIIGVNDKGHIVSCNSATEHLFGLEPAQLQDYAFDQLIPLADVTTLAQLVDHSSWNEDTPFRQGLLDTKGLRLDGTRFPIQLMVGKVQHDAAIKYTCVVRDMTDIQQAEAFLAIYARALDCSANGIMITSALIHPQPLVYVNPAFERITGFISAHVLGRDISFLNGNDTDATDLAAFSQAIQNGQEMVLTLKQYKCNHEVFYNRMSASPVRDHEQRITHYIYVLDDVTESIEAKQKLIEHTARLNATFELSPDGFVIFDHQGYLKGFNAAFASMVPNTPTDIQLHAFDHWFANLCQHPAQYPRITNHQLSESHHIIHIIQPSHKVLERDVKRNLEGSGETIIYFRDITQQTEVDQMKSEFLASAAHELRTPLASILGYVELLLHRQYTQDKQRDMLQTVHKQSQLLASLINELLDLSRIEARRGKDFNIVPTSLHSLIQDAIRNLKGQTNERPIVVHPMPDVTVMADESKIMQALNNLLDNARKFSPIDQPIEIHVQSKMKDDMGYIEICISDHGMGMTPEQLDKAFERFYRADTSGNVPGTGLGLNLVREIALLHGGSVELTSQWQQGTQAHLTLRQSNTPALLQKTSPSNF